MTIQNGNSPPTRNASGQENGTEIEARGLSSAVNGTRTENLSARKSLASAQASEATAVRPSMEAPTAEGIGATRTVGGNETSSKADASPMLQKIPFVRDKDGYFIHPDLLHFWTVTMDGAERCTPEQWAALEARACIKTSIYHLECENEDHPAYVSYFDKGNLDISAWDPSPEPGWWLIEIGDSEDGPYAIYATQA